MLSKHACIEKDTKKRESLKCINQGNGYPYLAFYIVQLFPFFNRAERVFITKADLQKDFKNLLLYFSGLSEEESKTFNEGYKHYLPDLESSFKAHM